MGQWPAMHHAVTRAPLGEKNGEFIWTTFAYLYFIFCYHDREPCTSHQGSVNLTTPRFRIDRAWWDTQVRVEATMTPILVSFSTATTTNKAQQGILHIAWHTTFWVPCIVLMRLCQLRSESSESYTHSFCSGGGSGANVDAITRVVLTNKNAVENVLTPVSPVMIFTERVAWT